MITRFIKGVIVLILFGYGLGMRENDVSAQELKCGTEKAMEAQFRRFPEARLQMEAFEKSMKQLKAQAVSGMLHGQQTQDPDPCSQQLYVIPVVFHVFYGSSEQEAAQLVPMSQLQSALDIANEDFNMTNTTLINSIDPTFKPIASKLRVKFVLAKLDPQGKPTSGATFHPQAIGFGDATAEAETEVRKYAWDNYKYCNVYVMNYLYKGNAPKPVVSFGVTNKVTDPEYKKDIFGENSTMFLYVKENYFNNGSVGLNAISPKIDLRTVTNPELVFSDNLSWDYAYPTARPDDLGTTVYVSESSTGPWTKIATASTNKADMNKWIRRTYSLSAYAGKQVYIRILRNMHHYYYGIDNFGVRTTGSSTFAYQETFESTTAGALPTGWTSDVTDYNAPDPNNSGVAWYPDKGMNDRNVARVVFNGWFLGMGGISKNNRSFNSTFSHELGHWLNLKHTFDGYNCAGIGDEVDDTPPTNKAGGGCSVSLCGGKINGENFMDYNTTCYKMFTKGQIDRMTAATGHVARKSIWSLENLVATGVRAAYDNTCTPQGKFYMSAEKVTAGIKTTVNFEDRSVGFPTSWEWTIDNGSGTPVKSTARTAAAEFEKEGNYTITLKVKNENGETTITRNLIVAQKEETNCKGGDDFNTTPVGNLPGSWTAAIPSGNFAVAKVSKDEYVDLDGPYATIKSADNSTYLYLSENFNTEQNKADEINITTAKYSLTALTNPGIYFSDNLAWDRSWPSARPVDEATTILASESLAGPWVVVAKPATDKANMGKWNERKFKLPAQFAGKEVFIRIQRSNHHFFYAFEDFCIKEWDGSNNPDPEPEPSMGADCKAGENFNKMTAGSKPIGWTAGIPVGSKANFKVSTSENVNLDGRAATVKANDNTQFLFMGENFNDDANNWDELTITSGKISLKNITKSTLNFVDNLAWDASWPAARPDDNATLIQISENGTTGWATVATLSTNKVQFGKWNTRTVDIKAYDGKEVYFRIVRNEHHYYYAVDDICIKEGSTTNPGNPDPSMGEGCKAGENFNKMTAGTAPVGWTAGIPVGSKANFKISTSENVNLDGRAGIVKAADNTQFLFMGENFNDDANNWDELTITSGKLSLKNITKASLSFTDNLAWDASWPAARPDDNATLIQISENGTTGWNTVATLATNKTQFGKWNARTVDLRAYDGKEVYMRIVRKEHHYYYAVDDICIKDGGGTNPNPDPEPSMGADCKAGENFNKMTAGAQPTGWTLAAPAGNKATVKITTSENVDIDGLKSTIKSADNSNYLFLGENFNDDINGADKLDLTSGKHSLKNVKNATLTFSDNFGWDPSWPDPRPDDEATTVYVSESLTGTWTEVAKLKTNKSQFAKWNARSISIKAFDGKDIYVRISRSAHHYYYAVEDLCIKGDAGGNPNPDPGGNDPDCKAGEDFNKLTEGAAPAGWNVSIPAGNKSAVKLSKSETVDVDGTATTVKSADQSLFLFAGENYNETTGKPDEMSITTPKISLKGLKEVVLYFSDNLAWDALWPEARPDDNATVILVSENAAGPFTEVTKISTNKSKFGLWNARTVDLSKYNGKDIYVQFRRTAHHFYYAVENVCIKGKVDNTNPGNPEPKPETTPLGKGDAFSLLITPNPVFTDLRVSFLNRIPGAVNMEIIDMSGRVLIRKSVKSKGDKAESYVWPVGSLTPGVYLLRINNGALKESQRFLKY